MNGLSASTKSLVQTLNSSKLDSSVEVVIAPPAIYLLLVQEHLTNPQVQVAAQNVFDKAQGAFTGEISAEQLKDSNIHWVILGHSERRTILGESDQFVASKTEFALSQGLGVILCCGESLETRESNNTVPFIKTQLEAVLTVVKDWSSIVIAYEPIWAIGTGKVATPQQAQDVHAEIRGWLRERLGYNVAESTRIIYGGSVNGKNAKELSEAGDIDGFLVGGASLKPEFIDIVNCKSK